VVAKKEVKEAEEMVKGLWRAKEKAQKAKKYQAVRKGLSGQVVKFQT
jgi:hypothetical protein